jgi:hypothetical protein
MEYKIFLLKKYQNKGDSKPTTFFNLTFKDIIKKYNGFEGTGIFYEEPKNENQLLEFINTCKELLRNKKEMEEYLLLYVGIPNAKIPAIIKKESEKIGYEYGNLEDEYQIYSSIFQEIILGDFDELIAFKDKLNKHLLFPTKEIAEEYVKVHHQLTEEGKGVEMEEILDIYEIWKFKI